MGLLTLALVAGACSGGDGSSPTTTAAPSTTEAAVETTTTTARTPSTTDAPTVGAGFDIVEPDRDPTPIVLDDEIAHGVLDNGLTYYAMSNDSPGAKLELRLVVNAGSAKQPIADAGSAHFLEHMLFNGTERFPGLELDAVLRGFGLEIGPDLNAYTSLDETVYILSIPTAQEGAVATGFEVLVDWATAATLDEQDVIEERGVVREELRLRDESAGGQLNGVLFDYYYADSSYSGHEPSGSADNVLATTASELREFYEKWYRLDNMAVVAVGDLPIDDIVELIESSFGALSPPEGMLTEFEYQIDDLDEAVVDIATHPDGPEANISLDFGIPNWDGSTIGGERLGFLDALVADLLAARLEDGAARGELDIVRPHGHTFSGARHRSFLGFNFVAGDAVDGSLAVLTTIGRATNQGFNEDEITRSVAELQAAIDQEIQAIGSRQDSSIAASLVGTFLDGRPLGDPDETYERQSALLDSITAEDATNHLRYILSRSAPILVPIGTDPDEFPSLEELAEVVEQAAIDALEAEVRTASSVSPGDPLMERPEAVDVVRRSTVADIEAVEVEYANGVKVYVVESTIAEGSMFVYSISSGGASLLDPGDAPIAELVSDAVGASGLGDFDSVDLETALSSSVAGASPYIGDYDEGFSAGGSAEDAELIFQLIHLLATEADVEESAWRDAQENGRSWARQMEANPGSAAYQELLNARFGDTEWARISPDVERLDDMTAAEALELYQSRLTGVDDMIVVVVGDVNKNVAIDLASSYLGTLPTRQSDESIDRTGPMPPGITTRTVSAGVDEAGAGIDMLMSTSDSVTDDRALALILESAINARLFESVREGLAASYGGGSAFIAVDDRFGTAELLLTVDGDPERLDEIHTVILAELDDIGANGLTSDEFDEARAVVLNDLDFINNSDLIDEIVEYARHGDDAWTLRRQYLATFDSSIRSVNDLASRLIDTSNRIEVFRSNG